MIVRQESHRYLSDTLELESRERRKDLPVPGVMGEFISALLLSFLPSLSVFICRDGSLTSPELPVLSC